jgi:uncharacterized protein YodC (DUF2158 family)
LAAVPIQKELTTLTSRKWDSIAIALTLGVALGTLLSVPAFADPDSSSAATQSQAAPTLRAGDLVRARSDGPLMTVTGVQGDHVNCAWTDWTGDLKSESFPAALLGLPVTVPPDDPRLQHDERETNRYNRTHCRSGWVSHGKFNCAC